VEWIKFNVDMNGYYIVHYAEDWKTLIDLLRKNHTALSPKDRANLINNIFKLAGYDFILENLVNMCLNFSPGLRSDLDFREDCFRKFLI